MPKHKDDLFFLQDRPYKYGLSKLLIQERMTLQHD